LGSLTDNQKRSVCSVAELRDVAVLAGALPEDVGRAVEVVSPRLIRSISIIISYSFVSIFVGVGLHLDESSGSILPAEPANASILKISEI
jgi:hypothetical protein